MVNRGSEGRINSGVAREHLALRYEPLYGIVWDQVFLDGSKKPLKKGCRVRLKPACVIFIRSGLVG